MRLQTSELPVGGARLALLVDREADDGGAVLARERHHPVEARAGALAVLEVRRVEDRLAARVLQPASITGGSVESSTSGSGAWVAKRDDELVHVGDAVAADVVDAHVEHVRALASPARVPSARRCPSRRRASRRGTSSSRSRSCARR